MITLKESLKSTMEKFYQRRHHKQKRMSMCLVYVSVYPCTHLSMFSFSTSAYAAITTFNQTLRYYQCNSTNSYNSICSFIHSLGLTSN